jgi:hypothetical protein
MKFDLLIISLQVLMCHFFFQNQFTDLARQLEMSFIQKQFLVHAHKPELILKEDSSDLRAEVQKKDELIRRHYKKLSHWQAMLQVSFNSKTLFKHCICILGKFLA